MADESRHGDSWEPPGPPAWRPPHDASLGPSERRHDQPQAPQQWTADHTNPYDLQTGAEPAGPHGGGPAGAPHQSGPWSPGYGPARPLGPVPLDAPYYNVGPVESVRRYWRKYATFSGRASRAEFWWMVLVNYLVGLVIGVVSLLVGLGIEGFSLETLTGLSRGLSPTQIPRDLWLLATVVPNAALAVRRLHDSNRSGWFYLLMAPNLLYTVWQLFSPTAVPTFDPSNPPTTSELLLPLLGLIPLLIAVPLLVFYLLGPNPAGQRLDHEVAAARPAPS